MAERARWIPLMTSATRPPTPLQFVSLHSVAPKAKKNISGQLHCNNMILSNIYKYNHVSSGPPRLPGNSLVKIAEWRGNTNNQWSIAEASERCLYLVFLGISALFHLFFLFYFFLEIWPTICVHVQYKMIVFFFLVICVLQRSTYYISTAWYPYTFSLE